MDPGPLGSGSGSTPHSTDVQRVESLADTLPSPPQPRALQPGLWLKALYLLLALKGLLCSFPWVQQVLQLQRSLLRRFGSAAQDLLALKDPALLVSIAHGFNEAALTLHRSLRGAFPLGTTSPCGTSPREEDSTERTLFSRFQEKLSRHSVCSLLNMHPGSLDSGPGSTLHDTDEEWFESLPFLVIIQSVSLKLMLCQLLLQLEPRALRTGISLKAQCLLLDLKELLCSFPWVQVTEEKQEANTLLQSTAVNQVSQRVLDRLEQTLGPRCVLREAGAFSSLLLQHHLLHLVALVTAQLLPDEESTHQEGQVVAALRPLPPHFTISSDLVEVLLVQLVLTLHPVDGSGDQPLSPQDLQELLVHLTTVTHHTLNNTPGVAVDTCSPLPLCSTRQPVLQLQSSILGTFKSATQELLARRDPALLASIANGVAEAALAIHRSLRQPFPLGSTFKSVTTPREEDSIERTSSLSSTEVREEQKDHKRKAHICPLLEVRLVEGPPFFMPPDGMKRKRVTWKVPLESTEPVAPKPEEKKKQRKKKKWSSRFRGLFCCCTGQSE